MIVGRYKGDLCLTYRKITIIFKGEDMDIIEDNSDIINDINIDMNSILELRVKEGSSKITISRDRLVFFTFPNNKVYFFGKKGGILGVNYNTARTHIRNHGILRNKSITIKNGTNLDHINNYSYNYIATIKIKSIK